MNVLVRVTVALPIPRLQAERNIHLVCALVEQLPRHVSQAPEC